MYNSKWKILFTIEVLVSILNTIFNVCKRITNKKTIKKESIVIKINLFINISMKFYGFMWPKT